MHVSPRSGTSLPTPPILPISVITELQAELPVLQSSDSWLSLIGYCTHGSVNMSKGLSQFVPPSPQPVSTRPFAASASPMLPCKQAHQYRLSGLHIYAFLYDICLSLSD